MGNNANSLCPRCKEQEESHPHFIFHCRLSQTTLDFINKLINLNYTFRTPFRISIKDIFLRHIIFCWRKAFYGDGYEKIQELSNFTGNLVSRFNKLTDLSDELGSRESFLRKWNSLLNISDTLNIQFNCP